MEPFRYGPTNLTETVMSEQVIATKTPYELMSHEAPSLNSLVLAVKQARISVSHPTARTFEHSAGNTTETQTGELKLMAINWAMHKNHAKH